MRNIDFQSVRPAALHTAESDTADKMSAGRTGHRPMFLYIRIKEAAGRARDHEAIAELRALLEETTNEQS